MSNRRPLSALRFVMTRKLPSTSLSSGYFFFSSSIDAPSYSLTIVLPFLSRRVTLTLTLPLLIESDVLVTFPPGPRGSRASGAAFFVSSFLSGPFPEIARSARPARSRTSRSSDFRAFSSSGRALSPSSTSFLVAASRTA